MLAGKLRNRVTIQTPATGEDAAGQPAIGWTDVMTVWADVRHLSGIETAKAAIVSEVKASIRIRYTTGVTPSMRVLVGTAYYYITAVLEDVAKHQYLDLVCEVRNV
jgi:SPP1 family predicted phage head-tail adaptor